MALSYMNNLKDPDYRGRIKGLMNQSEPQDRIIYSCTI